MKQELKPFFKEINEKTDRTVEALLIGYFVFGIFLAFFYDTWLVGLGVGSISLMLYFGSKYTFKHNIIHHYIGSLVLGIFMAQFIYQMHGLFEMHFTAFIAIIALIAYQNIWVFLPLTLFIIVHHSTFAYIQYLGYSQQIPDYKLIYFTQLDYMDFQTFLFHAGLVVVGMILAALYAVALRKRTVQIAYSILDLRQRDERLQVNMEFAHAIAEANYDKAYEDDNIDSMGKALIEMRNNLKESSAREKQEKFTNLGLARVAEIIRNNGSDDIHKLAYETISYLVKYINLNQGGLFVLNDNEEDKESYLELMGCYAYERKKYLEKQVAIGQGLLGQCYKEGDIIYLKEIPKNYVNITSGLGESTPTTMILVPIKNEEHIVGVMELAGFQELKKYEIDFLKEVGQSVAIAIHSAKVNERTRLLYEQSQQQTEEMRAQEEEMRQNMEELAATQEEMERKQKEYETALINAEEKVAELTQKLSESNELIATYKKERNMN